MPVFPRRSPGVISAPLSGTTVVYDLLTETRHRLDPGTSTVFTACDGRTDRDTAVTRWADQAGIGAELVAGRVDATLTRLGELGLVGRATPWKPPMPRLGVEPADDAPHRGAAHRVLDGTIRFVGDDEALLRRIDDYLGTATTAASPPDGTSPVEASPGAATPEPGPDELVFRVQWLPHDEVRLVTDEVADHADEGVLLRRLVTVVNEYAVATHGCLALHAGAVRSPDGHVVVLPGLSGAGKSTLTAALVATGWDYLGDEVAGIDPQGTVLGYPKRLALDPQSRDVVGLSPDPESTVDPDDLRAGVVRLAGRIGPAAAVVFPTFRPGPVEVDELDVEGAFDAVLAQTLNLARTGQRDLETLCELAESVPMIRLGHNDVFAASARITDLVG